MGDRDIKGNFGIRNPIRKGSVQKILQDRKRWTDQLNSTFGQPATSLSPADQARVSKTDTGHEFWTAKWQVLQSARWYETRSTGYKDYPVFGDVNVVTPPGFPVTPSDLSARGANSATYSYGVASESGLQNRMNITFANMWPHAPVVKIGETLVELLRGEIPKSLKTLKYLIQTMNSKRLSVSDRKLGMALSGIGSETLALEFGWRPMIQSIIDLIHTAIAIDHMVYGQSYRRKREIRFSTRSRETESFLVARPGLGLGSASVSGPGTWHKWAGTSVLTYDVRLSARIAPIARPTIGSNSFIDQADDKLRQLGLWYPALGWDLLPYSWLVDWFSHLGSSITNAYYYSTRNGVKPIDYAWATALMRHSTDAGAAVPYYQSGSVKSTVYGRSLTTSVVKRRYGATPFGFGLDLSGLSTNQFGILVALGLAKAR